MAHLVDYSEVTSMARPGFGRHGGQQFVVKERFEEVEQVTPRGRSPLGYQRGNHGHGGGVQKFVVKETVEEVEQVTPPGLSHYGHQRGHHGGGGVQQFVVKETVEEVVTPPGRSHHGHGSGRFQACETKFEEELNTRTGEFHERKENVLVRDY